MTVNPHIQPLLDQLAASDAPPGWEVGPGPTRELYRALHQMTDPTDVPIGKTEDVTFKGPGGDVTARIYTPVAGGSALKCLVFFHGGGFTIGDLESHDALCRQLANAAGCKVMAVDYRLAPEHKYPAALEDAWAAVKWIEKNASEFGIDANCLAVAGDSAGGNLAAVVAQKAAKSKGGPRICFQLLIYPTTKVLADTQSMKDFAEGFFLERKTMDWFMECYLPVDQDHSDPCVSPLLAEDVSGLPPAMIITAGHDPLRDEGKAYADRLAGSGVDVTYKDYPDMIHGFFNMTALAPEAKEAVVEAAKAVKAAWPI
jgi:acetyl esterase